ncbi:MAG TPA: hypothetical protein VEJ18_13125 [Planctomycetota bacterium]|nr:hypothetical protein [Planctomycetota bacterium]
MKTAWIPLPLAAGLLVAALARPTPPPTKPPLTSVNEAPATAAEPEPVVEPGPEAEAAPEDFWTALPAATRPEAMALTTVHLGLGAGEAATFVAVATRALAQIERAWRHRESLVAHGAILDDAAIDEAYATAKSLEEASILALLGSSPAHLEFRDRLGEWIDALRGM